MFISIDSCREHLREYLPWVDDTKTSDDTREFIKSSKSKYAAGNGFDAGIWYKDEFAGVIGFHSINRSINEISIGYWLDKRYVGKGIMKKACEALIDYAFYIYKLNRVEIMCAATNFRSRSIPEKLGFTQEGITRDGELLYGSYVDCVIYGILKSEWENSPLSTRLILQ